MKKKEKKQKVNRNRKPLSITDKMALVFFVVLIIYLTITLPIHYQFAAFSWHWFAFGLMALLFPCAFMYVKVYAENRYTLTKEKSQRANLLLVGRILFYWLADCAYMAIFNQWTVWIYILCGITLLVIFWNLVRAFLGQTEKGGIFGFSLLFDFLVGVGLTIYLLSLIADSSLQQIITSIVAAIFGGVFTLVGVAWTIRKGDEDRRADRLQVEADRKEEERKKLIPYIKIVETENEEKKLEKLSETGTLVRLHEEQFTQHDKIIYRMRFCRTFIKNISLNTILFKGLNINGVPCSITNAENLAYSQETTCIIVTHNYFFEALEPIKSLQLIYSDILENKYYFDCEVRIAEQQTVTSPQGEIHFLTYYITKVGLPKLKKTSKETTNE